ncbi:MAG: DUF1614 domain-containing protein [Candidatus Omnitrophica bacterium]|nr:DUF1614 domain-containing protein [Candidatus Omnitrophota bacterium]MCM8807211.1 DUF1614 domain-containing protein [Candidatus Omnitrophota bacterium]
MFFLPFSLILLLIFLILLLPFLFFLLQIEIIRIALGKLGLSPFFAFLVLLASLIGSGINIPIYSREATIFHPYRELFFLFQPFGLPEIETKQIIAINVGGAIIPILLCIYLLPKAPLLPTFFSTIISTIICFKLSKIIPGIGITIPALIPPIIAVLLAFIFAPQNKIPVAYISGVLGVLIGADLLNLPNLPSYPGVMSIGGAGVYDGIFLVGIISVLLA